MVGAFRRGPGSVESIQKIVEQAWYRVGQREKEGVLRLDAPLTFQVHNYVCEPDESHQKKPARQGVDGCRGVDG